MGIKLFLSSDQILNKVFNGVPNGYDPFEVDEFLDRIISDYKMVEVNETTSFNGKERMEQEIASLKEKNQNLEIELTKLKAQVANIKPADNVNLDNINFIKRINALETFLYKEGYDPSTIK